MQPNDLKPGNIVTINGKEVVIEHLFSNEVSYYNLKTKAKGTAERRLIEPIEIPEETLGGRTIKYFHQLQNWFAAKEVNLPSYPTSH